MNIMVVYFQGSLLFCSLFAITSETAQNDLTPCYEKSLDATALKFQLKPWRHAWLSASGTGIYHLQFVHCLQFRHCPISACLAPTVCEWPEGRDYLLKVLCNPTVSTIVLGDIQSTHLSFLSSSWSLASPQLVLLSLFLIHFQYMQT